MSHITTHVLDTQSGRPAAGIQVTLRTSSAGASSEDIARGVTNGDGRVADLLADDVTLSPGTYVMMFDTGGYFARLGVDNFYPVVEIAFRVVDDSHYHVPLLLSPFGYSTYRGS